MLCRYGNTTNGHKPIAVRGQLLGVTPMCNLDDGMTYMSKGHCEAGRLTGLSLLRCRASARLGTGWSQLVDLL